MESTLFERIEPQLRKIESRFEELDAMLGDPSIGADGTRMGALMKERGAMSETVERYRSLKALAREIADTKAELRGATDPEMRSYCGEVLGDLEARWEPAEAALLEEFVRDEDDHVEGAILEIRAGTGGDEATLWASEILRMYARLCERRRWKLELLEEHRSAVDGIKEAILSVKGKGAFAALKYESGGHRVQRVPSTESQGRIHTSAATVAVLPEATEVEVEIHDVDLRIDAFRSSGPGGQSVNKTSSAIRVTHIPSGLVVSCQDEKSQHKNKAKALKILRSRLYDLERQKANQARSTQRKTLIGSGDRSERIRTYNFPESRISDHRIKLNLYNLPAVLEGDLDELIESLASYDREQRLQGLADGIA
jgi:peptide chain release factor 1